MIIEVKNNKTGQTMSANLQNSSNNEIVNFISFYKRMKENGIKKYTVKTIE